MQLCLSTHFGLGIRPRLGERIEMWQGEIGGFGGVWNPGSNQRGMHRASSGSRPVSENLVASGITLPSHPPLGKPDVADSRARDQESHHDDAGQTTTHHPLLHEPQLGQERRHILEAA